MRNIKDAYKKAHLSWKADNEFQLKKDVEAIATRVTTLEAIVNKLKPLVKATVTFDSDGGSSVASQTIVFGEKATRPSPDPTKANNRFINWFEGESTSPFDFANTIIEENKTLTAHWSTLYTVTYEKGNDAVTGTVPTQDSCITGETFTVADASTLAYEGHTFVNWTDGTNTYNPGDTYTVAEANVTLTAVWSE